MRVAKLVENSKLPWLGFIASLVAAWIFAERAWMLSWYQQGNACLLLVTTAAAMLLLARRPYNPGKVALVVVCLVVGNWRFFEGSAMQLFWSAAGFAP
jgi:hypothetical protein